MQVPSITTKAWTGASGEHFTYEDMNRVLSNCSSLLSAVLGETKSYPTFTHQSQFDYSVANDLEDALQRMTDHLHRTEDYDTSWAAMRSISYVDFERWETGLSTIHDAAARKKVVTITALEMPDADWILSDSTRTVASGHGIGATQTFELVEQGAAVLSIDQYGIHKDITLTIGSAETQTISIRDNLCSVSLNADCEIDTWYANGYALPLEPGLKYGIVTILGQSSVTFSVTPTDFAISGGGSRNIVHSIVGGPMEGVSSNTSTRSIRVVTTEPKTVYLDDLAEVIEIPTTIEPIAYRFDGSNQVTIPQGTYIVAAISGGSTLAGGRVVLNEGMSLGGTYNFVSGGSGARSRITMVGGSDILDTDDGVRISDGGGVSSGTLTIRGFAGIMGFTSTSLRGAYPGIASMLEQFYPGNVDTVYDTQSDGLSAESGSAYMRIFYPISGNDVTWRFYGGGGGIAGGDGGDPGSTGIVSSLGGSGGSPGRGGTGYGAGGGGPTDTDQIGLTVYELGGAGGGGGIGTEYRAGTQYGAPGAIWLMWVSD